MNYFMPPVFGGLSFFLYIVIYFPTPGSEDFITALMVLFAAQAFSAVIILSKEKKRWILIVYIFLSVLIPIILPLFFYDYNLLWHIVLVCLIVLGIIGLLLFVPGYLKYRRER